MTSIIIFDSTLVKFVAFSNQELPIVMYVWIFATILVLMIVFSTVLLISVNKSNTSKYFKGELSLKLSYFVICLVQVAIFAIMISIILSIILVKNYAIASLLAETYLSYITAIFFLVVLVYTLVKWFSSNRNQTVLLYAISFSLVCLNLVTSIIYITYQFSFHVPSVKPNSIHLYLLNLPRSDLSKPFGFMLDILSILSFVTIWISTSKLLSQYSNRLGKKRYWAIVSMPLIYFIFPFETYFGGIFHEFIVDSPVVNSIIYVLFFGATKEIGGVLFSMVFLTASTIVKVPNLRNSLIVTSIGIAIVFGSIEIDTLLYAVYPPFGLITVSIIPIGTYLIYTGIFSSAKRISEDAKLRKELYRTAENQMKLLKTIGATQMEQHLMNTFRTVSKRAITFGNNEVPEPEKEEVKQIIKDVLNELQSRSRNKTDSK